ncbi:MAG: YihY family inner membrane protein [Planctomycetes bacterium]|nr:YihY family inner membrane protein [Planctomycetota bacterium]
MQAGSQGQGWGERFQRAQRFLRRDVWEIEVGDLRRGRRTLLHGLRTALLVVRGFVRDRCPLRASALTYITLVTIVPAMALMFAIAKAFGAHEKLGGFLVDRIPEHLSQVRPLVQNVVSVIQTTDLTKLGWVGLVILVYGWLRGLGSIEKTFNDIWGVRRSRTLTRKVSDYLCVSVIVPVLLVVASGLNASLSSQTVVAKVTEWLGPLAWLYLKGLRGLPFVTVAVAFTAFYMFMPNTQVRFRSGLMAGIVAGTLWYASQYLYIRFQIGISQFSTVYGTFAALPAFLVWLYLGWLIVIFGAEVAFAHQNADTFPREMQVETLPQAERERIALEVLGEVVARYANGSGGPWRPKEFQASARIPIRRVNAVVEDLVNAGVLAEVGGRSPGYLPARDPGQIRIAEVLASLRRGTVEGEAVAPGESQARLPSKEVRAVLAKVQEGVARSLDGATVRDLAGK